MLVSQICQNVKATGQQLGKWILSTESQRRMKTQSDIVKEATGFNDPNKSYTSLWGLTRIYG